MIKSFMPNFQSQNKIWKRAKDTDLEFFLYITRLENC